MEEAAVTEEISSEQHQNIPDNVQGMLQLLEQDIDILVHDDGLVQSILTEVQDSLTPNLALVLAPAPYIKGFQHQIMEAKKRIADRATRQS
jgi:hypothetical protein